MKNIDQKSVDTAFELGAVKKITIRKISEKQWYFTFEAEDPTSGSTELFALETQRGALRTWADPRVLFEFLEKRGVSSGIFNLNEDLQNEINPKTGRCT